MKRNVEALGSLPVSKRTIQFATSDDNLVAISIDPKPEAMTAALQQPPLAAMPRRRHSHPPAFKRQRRSCLRATSAYCGAGSRLEELSPTRAITVRFGDEPKKELTFADQRGLRLEARREFCPRDAPTEFCEVEQEPERPLRRRRSASLDDRWTPEADALARQHLLSMCVVSCSILTAALIGLRQASK